MNLLDFYCLSWVFAGTVMATSFIILLVHVRRGNKNKWLTMVVSQLICSNIGSVLVGYGLYGVYIKKPVD